MRNKRGLSQIVTMIIFIFLVIVAIAIIWAVISKFFVNDAGKINLSPLTIDLEIVSAKLNNSLGVAEVQVKRNRGEGNLIGLKFVVKDSENSEMFDESFSGFEEFGQRIFYLNLLFEGSSLKMNDIQEISVAPVYVAENGKEAIGHVTDTISGLQDPEVTFGDYIGGGSDCFDNFDCGEDYFIDGTKVCNELDDAVLQYKKIFHCVSGFCLTPENSLVVVESCSSGFYCSDGNCVMESLPCKNETVQTDCGVDEWIGSPSCQIKPSAVLQNYRTYSCVDGFCSASTKLTVKNICNGTEVCDGGNCFVPLECSADTDCDFGYVCGNGSCVEETALNMGVIRSVWPYNVGELFDSSDLPLNNSLDFDSKYVIFPGSAETRCLKVKEFVIPEIDGGVSYVRLNSVLTNISDGDNYEIWETEYGCSLI